MGVGVPNYIGYCWEIRVKRCYSVEGRETMSLAKLRVCDVLLEAAKFAFDRSDR